MHGSSPLYRRVFLCFLILASIVAGVTAQQITGRVGPIVSGDGTTPVVRQTRTSALVMQQASGKYAEAVLRGNTYYATVPAAGVALSVAINTTPSVTLWNPLGSGVNLRVLRVTVGYISGTMPAGSVVYTYNNNNTATNPSGGTAITPVNGLVGAGNASKAKCGFGQTVTGTPIMGETLFSSFAELATTANGFQPIVDDVDGRYIIQPSNGLNIAAISTAGSSPVITASFFWEEVTIGAE